MTSYQTIFAAPLDENHSPESIIDEVASCFEEIFEGATVTHCIPFDFSNDPDEYLYTIYYDSSTPQHPAHVAFN